MTPINQLPPFAQAEPVIPEGQDVVLVFSNQTDLRDHTTQRRLLRAKAYDVVVNCRSHAGTKLFSEFIRGLKVNPMLGYFYLRSPANIQASFAASLASDYATANNLMYMTQTTEGHTAASREEIIQTVQTEIGGWYDDHQASVSSATSSEPETDIRDNTGTEPGTFQDVAALDDATPSKTAQVSQQSRATNADAECRFCSRNGITKVDQYSVFLKQLKFL